jgi:hypothetical protein
MRLSSRIEAAVSWGLQLGLADWFDLVAATGELAVARIRLAFSGADRILADAPVRRPRATGRQVKERVQRVRVAIARASHRVPWRADCLVQAIAAQHWLRRHRISTSLSVGVTGKPGRNFEAHAWLTHGDAVITGGDVGGYVPQLRRTAKLTRTE